MGSRSAAGSLLRQLGPRLFNSTAAERALLSFSSEAVPPSPAVGMVGLMRTFHVRLSPRKAAKGEMLASYWDRYRSDASGPIWIDVWLGPWE
jgi:hypothetical protein